MRQGQDRRVDMMMLLMIGLALITFPGCDGGSPVTRILWVIGMFTMSFPTFVAIGTKLWNYFRQPDPDSAEESAPLATVIGAEVSDAEGSVIGLDSSDAEAWKLLKDYGLAADSDVCRWHDDGGALGTGD